MKFKFIKMQACGNDYIYFFNPFKTEDELKKFALFASDRRFGIGGDGIIAIESSARADIKMVMYNADGSRGAMCGNGVRCAAFFAKKYADVKNNSVTVETDCGVVSVKLTDIKSRSCTAQAAMPFPREYMSSQKVAAALLAAGVKIDKGDIFAIDVGNKHLAVFGGEKSAEFMAKKAEESGLFVGGVNVERCEETARGARVEVYERGSGYTFACGSGAVAAAKALSLRRGGDKFEIIMRGGTLWVTLAENAAYLKGEVKEVFEGSADYEI